MGLPIASLVVATNENDVPDEFFKTGVYRPRGSANTLATSSPSMDISRASNFERLVFDLQGRDPAATRQLFADTLVHAGQFDLSLHPAFGDLAARYGFVSGKSLHSDRIATIQDTYERHGMMIDPHTACAVKVAHEYRQPGVPMIVFETALPAKFAQTLIEATGRSPDRPARFDGLENRPRRIHMMPADAGTIMAFIAEHANGCR